MTPMNNPYDILFQPVQIGPVTAPNRFYQASLAPQSATVINNTSSAESTLLCDAVVMVTDRIPNDGLYHELKPALTEGRLDSLRVIGDAAAPNIIAQAVFSGHLAARQFDEETNPDETPFRVKRVNPG